MSGPNMRLITRIAALSFLTAVAAVHAGGIAPSPYWKNTIDFPDDPFRVQGTTSDEPDWIKFTILASQPDTVYFQDSVQYPFHYQFATEVLDPFLGIAPDAYDQVTLYAAGQQAILGAVIFPPSAGSPPPPAYREFGIQLVRRDAYTAEQVRDLFNLVRSKLNAGPDVQAYYFPAYEQLATAEANQDYLESEGIHISSSARWAQGNSCYAKGWALGRLKYFTGGDIQAAYTDGRLRPEDIVLTDGVPAEVPYVAGILSLSPSTPNSHVAILARNFDVPFVHLSLAADAAKAQSLVGHTIVLRAEDTDLHPCSIRLIDVEGVLTPEQTTEILALKSPPPLIISPMTSYGAYSVPTTDLTPDDVRYVGGKAANSGFLRRAIPDNCPVSLGITFDLWNAYMDQVMSSGRTLREEIALRLAPYSYPPDVAALAADLNDIREMIDDDTVFSPELQTAVIETLQDPQYGFDLNRNIRFRSSTNVEDSDQFTGAGLYDSRSGCLADDLDSNGSGPSICDPTESSERGVFRAIRKVFLSFYFDNAVLERLRHHIDETQVGMALLVHHSFPDDIEMANGVVILEKRDTVYTARVVTQLGAVSVTNPEGGAIPEEVEISRYSFGTYPTLLRGSSLVPLGATVMDWDADYIELMELLVAVAQRYELETGRTQFSLDYEFKKLAPDGRLNVDQVRRIPSPDTTPTITPFLVNEPTDYCLFQGEYGDVFGNHRSKALWRLETRNMWLTEENVAAGLLSDATHEYQIGCQLRTLAGAPADWLEAVHALDGADVLDEWTAPDLGNPRSFQLRTANVLRLVARSQSPILTIRDLGEPFGYDGGLLYLQTEYDQPVPSWDWSGHVTTTLDYHAIQPCFTPSVGDVPQERVITGQGVTITTRYYWPRDPRFVADYTAPLVRWVETIIEGYTREPIVLHGPYSQTYRPEHHNLGEHFIFEPALEPDITGEQLAELNSQQIRLLHVQLGFEEPIITIYSNHDYGDECSPCRSREPGDVSGDGLIDEGDIGPFIDVLLNGSANHDAACAADVNADQRTDARDIPALMGLLITDIPPPTPEGMALIPAGPFQMGDPFNEGEIAERPVHTVDISDFYMGRYEVTNGAYAEALNWAWGQGDLITVISGTVYKAATGTDRPYCYTTPSTSYARITWDGSTFGATLGKEDHPMVGVSFYGAAAYCNWRSAMARREPCYDLSTWACDFTKNGYRLPTEAEWEKGARGGLSGKRYPWGDTVDGTMANYWHSEDPFEVGSYPWTTPVGYYNGGQTPAGVDMANGYGLYDVHGNVWEWCNDWYQELYYASSPPNDPQGPPSGAYRVARGGSWQRDPIYARCSYRWDHVFGRGHATVGFRVALNRE